ncbi:MAG: hypothetical protein JXA30_10055 [Deltaproteobacteria bacterium]|nr:hypothetical protein [Deltaproteobacteria bacterium]
MDIVLDKRAARQIRLSAAGAVEDGDTETLREDVMDAFNEEQIEEIEQRIDSGDFYDFIAETLEEWSGDDVEEFMELLESQLSDFGIELKYANEDLEDEHEEDDGDEGLDLLDEDAEELEIEKEDEEEESF